MVVAKLALSGKQLGVFDAETVGDLKKIISDMIQVPCFEMIRDSVKLKLDDKLSQNDTIDVIVTNRVVTLALHCAGLTWSISTPDGAEIQREGGLCQVLKHFDSLETGAPAHAIYDFFYRNLEGIVYRCIDYHSTFSAHTYIVMIYEDPWHLYYADSESDLIELHITAVQDVSCLSDDDNKLFTEWLAKLPEFEVEYSSSSYESGSDSSD
jgi:hypothetical protein